MTTRSLARRIYSDQGERYVRNKQRRLKRIAVWLLGAVAALSALPAVFVLTGCAAARVDPCGTVNGVAIGKAVVKRCTGEGQTRTCTEVRGGSLSEAAGDLVGGIVSGLLGAFAL